MSGLVTIVESTQNQHVAVRTCSKSPPLLEELKTLSEVQMGRRQPGLGFACTVGFTWWQSKGRLASCLVFAGRPSTWREKKTFSGSRSICALDLFDGLHHVKSGTAAVRRQRSTHTLTGTGHPHMTLHLLPVCVCVSRGQDELSHTTETLITR